MPTREPSNRAMAAALRLWHAEISWVTDDPATLRQLADGLRTLSDACPADDCRSRDPVRGYAHARQLMAAHADHGCPRYSTAAEYTTGTRP
ncbi:hypothetical protein [Nocardia sp. NBC_00416]|uniref:hypothetical protein n=1 Tax=Nocardia sp. NBC_00416 TaxID=2975991 RepID=UPI002E1B289B